MMGLSCSELSKAVVVKAVLGPNIFIGAYPSDAMAVRMRWQPSVMRSLLMEKDSRI